MISIVIIDIIVVKCYNILVHIVNDIQLILADFT